MTFTRTKRRRVFHEKCRAIVQVAFAQSVMVRLVIAWIVSGTMFVSLMGSAWSQDSVTLPADSNETPLVKGSVWFDQETGEIKSFPVADSTRDSVHRDSRWLPKPKKVKQQNASKKTTSTAAPATGGGTGGNGFSFTNFLSWLLIVAAAISICALLLYLLSKFEPPAASSLSSGSTFQNKPDEETLERIKQLPPALRRTDVNMRTEAERLMNEGQYHYAIILLFGHQLLIADKCGWLRLSLGKTNRKYVRECQSKSYDAGRLLSHTVYSFDRSFFGDHPPTKEEFQKLWIENEKYESLANQSLGAVA